MTLSDLELGPRALWGAQRAFDQVTGEEHQLWADVREFCHHVGVVDLIRVKSMGVISVLQIMEALAANGMYLQPKVGDERFVRQRMGGARFREARNRVLAMRRNADRPMPIFPASPILPDWYPG